MLLRPFPFFQIWSWFCHFCLHLGTGMRSELRKHAEHTKVLLFRYYRTYHLVSYSIIPEHSCRYLSPEKYIFPMVMTFGSQECGPGMHKFSIYSSLLREVPHIWQKSTSTCLSKSEHSEDWFDYLALCS